MPPVDLSSNSAHSLMSTYSVCIGGPRTMVSLGLLPYRAYDGATVFGPPSPRVLLSCREERDISGVRPTYLHLYRRYVDRAPVLGFASGGEIDEGVRGDIVRAARHVDAEKVQGLAVGRVGHCHAKVILLAPRLWPERLPVDVAQAAWGVTEVAETTVAAATRAGARRTMAAEASRT